MTEQSFLAAVLTVAEKLNKSESAINWLVGGSASLFLQGVKITPNDIDFVIDPKDFDRGIMLLEGIVSIEKVSDCGAKSVMVNIPNVVGEVSSLPIEKSETVQITLKGTNIQIPVYPLARELKFYEARTDKVEKNKEKIRLIKKALGLL